VLETKKARSDESPAGAGNPAKKPAA